MKLAILHLSDIHIKAESDRVLGQAEAIAATFFDLARASDASLILVTGDISFGGEEAQFLWFKPFIDSIKEAVAQESDGVVDVIFVPGNHDCKLLPESKRRSILVDHIIANAGSIIEEEIVNDCTACQENYFSFRNALTSSIPVFDHKLWTEYEYQISGINVRVSAINASWMSSIKEKPGQLVFPVEQFEDVISEPSSLRLAMIHHPLNWYSQASYHPLKNALRSRSDAIFSGHEHTVASGEIVDAKAGRSLYFEAPALQGHGKEDIGGFSMVQFDLQNHSATSFECLLNGRDVKVLDGVDHKLSAGSDDAAGIIELSKSFLSSLKDPGGNFSHPEKERIELDDVFVYPDVEHREVDREPEIMSAEKLIADSTDGSRIRLFGKEKTGKTTLLYRAFCDLHAGGMAPLYINGARLRSVSETELGKILNKLAEEQYSKPEEFGRCTKSSRVALVDDLESIPGGAKNQHRAIVYIEKMFGPVFITTSDTYEMAELVDKEAVSTLQKYTDYEIKDFGHRMRHKLIKRWCLCGSVNTLRELDERVHLAETMMVTVLGKNLVPPRPLFLLILLQSGDSYQQAELQNSGFSYYYQYLITKSLKEAGATPDALGEIFHYLSQLAWLFKSGNSPRQDVRSLKAFNEIYSDKYTRIGFDKRLDLLCRARILHQVGDEIEFTYPYIYFFFVGKYLAENLDREDIKGLVIDACKALHKRENANSVLFLTHHSNNDWVIEQIADTLRGCFLNVAPMEFVEDVDAINGLVESTAKLFIKEIDVERNQQIERAIKDGIEVDEEEEQKGSDVPGAGDEPFDLSNQLNIMRRTAGILGQVTRNYYGSIERVKKAKYLSEVFDAPMRALRILVEEIVAEPEAFVAELDRLIGRVTDDIDTAEKKKRAKKIAFNVLGMASCGIMLDTAQHVVSDKLRDDICDLVEDRDTNAYRLIGAATRLMQPGNLPFSDLEKLARKVKTNAFAFTIFQSLVLYHLHLFHTTEIDKQRLCSLADISIKSSQLIDVQTRTKKLN